jgi:Xaa-Pro aminopeptidase
MMIKKRVEALRNLMKKNKIKAYLVPSTDPHQSEYVPVMWERRKWLSGFTGSAGDLAITLQKAGLWTDSRYFLQAEQQLQGSGIDLFKMGLPAVPTMLQWLKSELKSGDKVGIDPRLFSYNETRKMKSHLKEWGIKITPIETNLVDAIWPDQPAFPKDPLKPHPKKYAGLSVEEKLEKLRRQMKEEKVKAHILTTLDAIAWLFNIRGSDVEFNPVVIAYAIVTPKKAMLFTDPEKITRAVERHFGETVRIHPYDAFRKQLKKLVKNKAKVWLDPGSVSYWIVDILKKDCDLFFKESPVTRLKALKNKTEITGAKAAHIRDGVAMVSFLQWLEKAVPQGGVTEISAAEKLEEFRKALDLYQGPSFETISGYQEHGAIVHYASTPETNVELKSRGIFLIDSGGQYLDGTTDITRTVALGQPSAEQKDRFTRILKGHILLALTRFPRGTAGNQLDTIARKPLWDINQNYGHGTGHGIGAYLNVHEGPQAISYYRGLGVPLEPGMIISNEPGFYKAGEYGMRVENLIVVVEDKSGKTEQEFYTFETISFCPIDLKLINKSLLSSDELNWLNSYHKAVRNHLSPYLNRTEKEWLTKATQPI